MPSALISRRAFSYSLRAMGPLPHEIGFAAPFSDVHTYGGSESSTPTLNPTAPPIKAMLKAKARIIERPTQKIGRSNMLVLFIRKLHAPPLGIWLVHTYRQCLINRPGT
jgi:hypothetical protein